MAAAAAASGGDETATAAPWVVPVSATALRCNNPIRKIVEGLKKPDLPDKPHIALSLGDPTVFGNFPTTPVLVDAVERALRSGKHDGYVHSAGTVEARAAVAKWMSVEGVAPLSADVRLRDLCAAPHAYPPCPPIAPVTPTPTHTTTPTRRT